ncbi:hypothetical protein GCM10010172_65610 [Paractinoplanes ferrugineus]|uniref:Uncharacterized protein n=1 Tax=Paractinoplanes ferrugineus TaxID=113564 RepID=A0A919MEZ6_9ACTN|nr:hypothetical protein [Actinoplanes ferrugineus]GIE13278.1 hypothetical protein Afe05nite_51180 [Actinoplanes ferrugineus]
MEEKIDFGKFLQALGDFRRDNDVARPTAHTSSVSTRDWERVEQALADGANRR